VDERAVEDNDVAAEAVAEDNAEVAAEAAAAPAEEQAGVEGETEQA
ncbi:MAG: hypothetical protein HOY71_43420, partial [Nonomuraea sp.]|nr:hypothetical protein [Nonomuraea sp.]